VRAVHHTHAVVSVPMGTDRPVATFSGSGPCTSLRRPPAHGRPGFLAGNRMEVVPNRTAPDVETANGEARRRQAAFVIG